MNAAIHPLPAMKPHPPCNSEIEAALLGALLTHNRALDAVADIVGPEHFFEPVHGRIYEAARDMIDAGRTANPATLANRFEQEEALETVGGSRYLHDLAASVISIANAAEYARIIVDLWKRRELIDAGEILAADAREPDADVTTVTEALESRLTSLADREAQDTCRSLADSARIAADEIEAACEAKRGITGIPTGLVDLDWKLAGMQNSDLILLAGRPSMGKTALAGHIALSVARAGSPVLFFSTEMSHEQVTKRLIAAEAGITFGRLRAGTLDDLERLRIRDAAKALGEYPLTIDDEATLTVAKLRARARRHKRRHGLALIVVDYLQLLSASAEARRKYNDVAETTEISKGLKAVAKELRVPVLCLSQLSRQVESREDKRPQLADLRQSGALEQDADVVMFIYREEYYLEKAEPLAGQFKSDGAHEAAVAHWAERKAAANNRADIIVAKQRQGPCGTVSLYCDMSLMRFGNLDQRGRA